MKNKYIKTILVFILINASVLMWAVYDFYKISNDLRPVLYTEKFRNTPSVSLQASNILQNMTLEDKIENVDNTIKLYSGLSQFSSDRNVVIFELLDAVEMYNFTIIALILINELLLIMILLKFGFHGRSGAQ